MKIYLMSLKIENKTKIAVFGSAFNPPSLGHKSVIDSLSHFDKVILVPSISHAWGKEMLDYELRCKLVELFVKDLNSKKIEISKVEKDLYQPEQSVTTFAVLSALEKHYANAELTFIIGPDNFISFDKFVRYKEILTRWSVTVCPEKLNIRSTFIRDNLRNKKSVEKLTTFSVEKYLLENNVY